MAYRQLRRFWECLEEIPGLSLILEDWQSQLANDFDFAMQFLQPTSELARTYPCHRTQNHGCRRDIHQHSPGDYSASCSLAMPRCDPIPVQQSQLVLYVIRIERLCRPIITAFGLEENFTAEPIAEQTWSIGEYVRPPGERWPVYLSLPHSSGQLRRAIIELLAAKHKSFLLMTPTKSCWDVTTAGLVERSGSRFLALREHVMVNADGATLVDTELRAVVADSRQEMVAESPGKFVFSRRAEYWEVIYDGKKALLRNSKGTQCLAMLLHSPGEIFHSYTLDSVTSQKGVPFQRLFEDGIPRQEESGLKYLKGERDDLNERLKEAERNNDVGTVEAIRIKLAAVNQEILASVGLHGQKRKVHGITKKMYDNVSKAIRQARKIIAKELPALDEHLTIALQTGTEWSYRREFAVPWQD